MVWLITGKRGSLVLGISEAGTPLCNSTARHSPQPPGLGGFGEDMTPTLLRRIQRAKCRWRIVASNDRDMNIDLGADGLLERVKRSPETSHGMIRFFENADTVAVVMVLPDGRCAGIQRLMELVLQSNALEYRIAANYISFQRLRSKAETPSWLEFVGGKPFFFDDLSVTVGAPSSTTGDLS
jgi:hypothetical protein